MNNIFVRVVVIALALFGVYKLFPQVSKPVDYYIKNPSFQKEFVTPLVSNANKILPAKIQIPTPAIMGVSTEYANESPIKQLTDSVSKQAAELAAEQVSQIQKTASDQFCQVLLEKIKSQCGSE